MDQKLKIIEDNMFLSESKNWTKLSKTEKLTKFNSFAPVFCTENNIPEKNGDLCIFLKRKLDQKRLLTVKEVVYDGDCGEIKSIPGLEVIDDKFMLKRSDKRHSTLKSLPPKRKQTIKIKLNNNKKK